MKLVNTKTGKAVVEFEGTQAHFYNKFLESEMKEMGIPIPHGLRALYQGQDIIFLGNEDFLKAFREVYFMTSIDSKAFHWES